MQALFSPDSKFMQAMVRFGDLVILNFLFLLTCLPVFTIGAASTALYTVVFRMDTEKEGSLSRSYFQAFRENFKQGTLIFLILSLFTGAACINLLLFSWLGGTVGYVGILFSALLLTLVVLMYSLVFPLLSLFHSSIRAALKNALILSIAHLPRSVAAGILNVLPLGLLAVNLYAFMQSGMIWVFLYFSAAAYLISRILNRVFAPYLTEEEEAK